MSLGVFAELRGQEAAARRLSAAVDEPLPAYLFVGPSGSGKRQAARLFAGELFARSAEADQADRHRRLAAHEEHPDLVVIERVGAQISIEEAREVVRTASLSPMEAAVKVLLLVDFHLVGLRAPVLLKAIEEPPPTTVFIVLANDIPEELITIASRCVRIDFSPVPERAVVEHLESMGIDAELALAAAAGAGGDLVRAEVLARDPEVAARMATWQAIPYRLDGTGNAVATAVDDLLEMIDGAAAPMHERHGEELAAIDERAERFGERGSGRKEIADRHKRELRRHRTDELRVGLTAMAVVYRAALTDGMSIEPSEFVLAGELVQEAIAALPRNPTERLLLEATLAQMPHSFS